MKRAKPERPPRSWTIDDLLGLGKREGEKAQYLKAVPVLILEQWILGGREEGVANYAYTNHLARRLVSSGLVPPFKPKGTSNILGALGLTQSERNLTRPPLVEGKDSGMRRINLPYYEPLLQEYRQEYCQLYREDYQKLFPSPETEPDWGTSVLPKAYVEDDTPAAPRDEKPGLQDEIQALLAPIELALRGKQNAIERLREEKREVKAELEARTDKTPELSFVHTSPDFQGSEYEGKVTSIKDTIVGMLTRAEHSIRISTRQMDMFADDLIALKRRNPDVEITVLSRGPQGAEGDRKKLAGRAFGRMKEAGIRLPVEKDALHSRLVVVDTKEALVSSADLDFTQMDLEFNAGIWTNNPDVVAEAIRYFDNLLALSERD